MPADTAIRLEDGDHVVRFYDAEDELVSLVVGYLSAAVVDGDTVVMIATPSHREAFEAALDENGVAVDAVRSEGRLVTLDAAETLSRFIVGGMPDAAAFDAAVGEPIRAAGGRSKVRAYGEMVALLWQEGNVPAAIELEKLWNRLGDATPFALFCAYPAEIVGAPEMADGFAEVCHLHSGLVAGAPTTPGAEVSRRFAHGTHGARLARRFVADVLQGWERRDLVEDGLVVASELTANAVAHGRSDFVVGLSRRAGDVRIHVGDASSLEPVTRDGAAMVPSGHGLQIVETISHHWGHSLVDGGKVVWADLRTRPAGLSEE